MVEPAEAKVIGVEGRRAVVRIPRAAFGDVDPPTNRAAVARSAPQVVDVYVSPALRRLIEEPSSVFANARLIAAASLLAASRGQYVWDVDVAIALGAEATQEGVQAWRRENGLPRPPAPWPAGWAPAADVVERAQRLVQDDSESRESKAAPVSGAIPSRPQAHGRSDHSLVSVGDEVDGYQIQRELGRGGMGVVFLAFDPVLVMPVALKVIAPQLAGDDVIRQRFVREARIAASLRHPHALQIYKAGDAHGTLYVCMRYIDGPSLYDVIERGVFVQPDRAIEVIEQVAGALDEAHERGLVHRDVKPQNILLTNVGPNEFAYLTDFGLARVIADTGFTRTGDPLGTPSYMAPEQILGHEVGPPADIYSLGCVFYECLTGRKPFERENSQAILYAHAHELPRPVSELNTDLPRGLDEVVSRALAKEPGDRYPSAGVFAQSAREALE
jgi:serine/threonine-protein kinase